MGFNREEESKFRDKIRRDYIAFTQEEGNGIVVEPYSRAQFLKCAGVVACLAFLPVVIIWGSYGYFRLKNDSLDSLSAFASITGVIELAVAAFIGIGFMDMFPMLRFWERSRMTALFCGCLFWGSAGLLCLGIDYDLSVAIMGSLLVSIPAFIITAAVSRNTPSRRGYLYKSREDKNANS